MGGRIGKGGFTKLELGCIPDCFWLMDSKGMTPSEIDAYLNIPSGLTKRLMSFLWLRDKMHPERKSIEGSFYE